MKKPMIFFEADGATGGGGAPPPASGSLMDGQTPPSAAASDARPDGQTSPPVVNGPWINQDGSFTDGWIERLPEDMRVDAIKNPHFKSVNDVLRGYINAQRLIGKKGVIIPTEKSTPEEVAEFRKSLGVPETVEGYQAKPETLPEGMEWNDELAKPFLAIAHKHNIPQAALKELVAAHFQMEAIRGQTFMQQTAAETNRKYQEGITDLQGAWGKDFERNRQKVVQLANYAGIPVDSPGFSDPNMAKLIFRLSQDLSEDRLISSGQSNLQGGPGEMAKDIQTNPENPLYKKYHSGDPDTVSRVRGYLQEADRQRKARQ